MQQVYNKEMEKNSRLDILHLEKQNLSALCPRVCSLSLSLSVSLPLLTIDLLEEITK